MSGESLVETSRIRDAASCRAWLARLSADDGSRLSAVDRLLRSLIRSDQAPDLVLEIAEQARPVHLVELGGVIDRLDTGAFPMNEADRRRFLAAAESLRLGRNLYKQLHTRLVEDSGVSTRSVIPGTAPSLRAVLPLARALDFQARLLVALQRLRVAVDAEEWDELCMLAHHLRASTFIDTTLPDETPLLRPLTARALFVYPLLVRLSRPESRTQAEFAVLSRLARRWSGRVGFRLMDGAVSHDGGQGPSLAISERSSVRLVTHRLKRRLDERRAEVDALGRKGASRLPKGMTIESTQRLLTDLDQAWIAPGLVPRVPLVRLGEMRLRFGLPQIQAAQPQGRAASGSDRPVAWHSAASRAYIYGRFEQNTIIRMALGDEPVADPLLEWAGGARAADWVSIERQQSVFDVTFATEGLRLGSLVTVVLSAPADVKTPLLAQGTAQADGRRMFGRVVSLQQQLSSDSRQAPVQRVGVAMWPASPALVGVRLGEDPFFNDAFLLAPDPSSGEPLSLLMRTGTFRGADSAMLREAMRDVRIRVDHLIESGPDYDRVRISRLSP
jgi:hypothetical protein